LNGPLLRVRGITVKFPMRRVRLGEARPWITALDHVNLEVHAGGAVGIVGESGCGKSTLARAILALVKPQAGTIEWRGRTVAQGDPSGLRRVRRELQAVFQDPVGSLDPRMTLRETIAEALEALEGPQPPETAATRVRDALVEVGLDPAHGSRYPHELSGGQCQRAAIARAVVARPRLLVCDEVVSALDVSVQAQIVNLLDDLRRRHGLAVLFISHNLAVVRHLCEEVVVMYLGRVVEQASGSALFSAPRHPYTRALLAAVPAPDPDAVFATATGVNGAHEVPGPPPLAGCAYSPRCPRADEVCHAQSPSLADDGKGHLTACHHWRSSTPVP